MEYNFKEIEQKWQQKWKETNAYKVSNESDKPAFYVLDMFPYPSGAGLHVGHPLGYIASDIYSRYKRLKGFNVLHPMGFDSFGLPAEQYALETGQHPAVTTEKNIATFKSQLDKIGFCYDWSREVRTSDPSYYKWTQWIFLQLFNSYFCNTQQKARPIKELTEKYAAKGSKHFTAEEWNAKSKAEQEEVLMKRRLAFSAYGEVNWCEALGTVLANDEVVNGVSERGGYPVIKKKMRQWYLRITSYAERLLQGLETVNFSDSMKEMQRNWIGKSEGAEMEFEISGSDRSVKVYTTRPDTIFGVDFLVLAPEHELVSQITTTEQKVAVDEYLTYVKSRSDRERMAEVKQVTGCFTGAYAKNPFNGKPIQIWIAEYVLAGYGTGAIMAVPCGDQRDFSFAKHFNIPVTNIIGEAFNGEEANPTKEATLENSDFLNGMLMKDAIGVAINKIEELGIGKRKVNYRMRDAGFSRQRYWGEPFPIIWEDGVAIAMKETELPLELPHVEKYGPGPEGEGPLANLEDWVNVDLAPNPSPKEREAQDRPGYMQSTPEQWRSTFEFAKQNRKNSTEAEDKLWQLVRNRQIDGCKFRRQHPVSGYIPDFICLEKNLIVEIDGEYHNDEEQKIFDEARTKWLEEFNYTIIRFTNQQVLENTDYVLQAISEKLKEIEASVEGLNSPLPWRGVGGEVSPAKRETSTMPGYAGSSWYFLRYMDPNNDQTFCDRKASDYWGQVDVYVGGTEHAVGHLLYSRMWTKVLYDLGLIGFDEPFKKLVNQGMIGAHINYIYRLDYHYQIGEGASGVVNVEKFIEKYGVHPDEYKPVLPQIFISKEIGDKIIDETLSDIDEVKLTNAIGEAIGYMEGVSGQIKFVVSWKPLVVESSLINDGILDIELFKEKSRLANSKSVFVYDLNFHTHSELGKMGKRYHNAVNPDDLCNKYGADTFRMYEMFLGPVEQSKPWDTKGIEGVHRFLRKLWRLFYDELKGKAWTTDAPNDAELKVLHRTIKKIEQDTENFSYNTAVSAFMVCVNDLADLKCNKKDILNQLLILLVPYAPHISEELWQLLEMEGSVLDASYPVFDGKYLSEATKEYPVSINGKLRTSVIIPTESTQEEAEKEAYANETVQKWLEGKTPKKFIFVKGRMINIVI